MLTLDSIYLKDSVKIKECHQRGLWDADWIIIIWAYLNIDKQDNLRWFRQWVKQ